VDFGGKNRHKKRQTLYLKFKYGTFIDVGNLSKSMYKYPNLYYISMEKGCQYIL